MIEEKPFSHSYSFPMEAHLKKEKTPPLPPTSSSPSSSMKISADLQPSSDEEKAASANLSSPSTSKEEDLPSSSSAEKKRKFLETSTEKAENSHFAVESLMKSFSETEKAKEEEKTAKSDNLQLKCGEKEAEEVGVRTLNTLSTESREFEGKSSYKKISAAVKHMQGRREKQEDRHVLLEDLLSCADTVEGVQALREEFSSLGIFRASYYALFDGHCGSLASEFCSQNLHLQLVNNLKVLAASLKDQPPSLDEHLQLKMKKKMISAFLKTDYNFLLKYRVAKDGCTCLAALILNDDVYILWLGDSRAVCGEYKEGENKLVASRLTDDHKPNRADEKERIEKHGGFVMKTEGSVYRVAPPDYASVAKRIKMETCMQGASSIQPPILLAVSRSFGDRDMKAKSIVSSIPEIHTFRLKKHQCIVMACDGVWDVLSDQEVIELYEHSADNPETAASEIITTAFRLQSQDNLTVLILKFLQDENA